MNLEFIDIVHKYLFLYLYLHAFLKTTFPLNLKILNLILTKGIEITDLQAYIMTDLLG